MAWAADKDLRADWLLVAAEWVWDEDSAGLGCRSSRDEVGGRIRVGGWNCHDHADISRGDGSRGSRNVSYSNSSGGCVDGGNPAASKGNDNKSRPNM